MNPVLNSYVDFFEISQKMKNNPHTILTKDFLIKLIQLFFENASRFAVAACAGRDSKNDSLCTKTLLCRTKRLLEKKIQISEHVSFSQKCFALTGQYNARTELQIQECA